MSLKLKGYPNYSYTLLTCLPAEEDYYIFKETYIVILRKILLRKSESFFMAQTTALTHLYLIMRKPPLSLTHDISTPSPLCHQGLRHTLHVGHMTTLRIFLLDL
jgi:hypothetical protein